MHKFNSHLPLSVTAICSGTVAFLIVSYIGLIAVVMSYAALTIEFSQSVKNDESVVATLEKNYLSTVADITTTNYVAAGYSLPVATVFVPAKSVTALR